MVKADFLLLQCFTKLDGTRKGAIEFLKCLKEQGIIVYWSNTWKRLVPKSEAGKRRGSWRSIMENVTKILEITNREEWIKLKSENNL